MDVKIHWISPATLWNSTAVATLLLPDGAAANSSSESKTRFDFRHFIRIEKSGMKCDLFLSVSWHLFLLTFFNWSLHYSPITIIAFCKKILNVSFETSYPSWYLPSMVDTLKVIYIQPWTTLFSVIKLALKFDLEKLKKFPKNYFVILWQNFQRFPFFWKMFYTKVVVW